MKFKDITKKSFVEEIETWGKDSEVLTEDTERKTVADIIKKINGKPGDTFCIISDNVDSKRFSDEERENIKNSEDYNKAQEIVTKGIKQTGKFGNPEEETSYIVKGIDVEEAKKQGINLEKYGISTSHLKTVIVDKVAERNREECFAVASK